MMMIMVMLCRRGDGDGNEDKDDYGDDGNAGAYAIDLGGVGEDDNDSCHDVTMSLTLFT